MTMYLQSLPCIYGWCLVVVPLLSYCYITECSHVILELWFLHGIYLQLFQSVVNWHTGCNPNTMVPTWLRLNNRCNAIAFILLMIAAPLQFQWTYNNHAITIVHITTFYAHTNHTACHPTYHHVVCLCGPNQCHRGACRDQSWSPKM